MPILYRATQTLVVAIWLSLIIHCHNSSINAPYRITAHQITMQVYPESRSFQARDTITIDYRKDVTEFYFFIHKHLTVTNVSIGHQALPFTCCQPREKFPLAIKSDSANADKISLYAVHLPPNLNPRQIDIDYYGEGMDSRRYHTILQTLSGLVDEIGKLQKQCIFAEGWYPGLLDCPESFQLTITTPGYSGRIF